MTRQIIISSLPESDHQAANFFGAASLKLSQILFGKAAQMRAFTLKAERDGTQVVFCHRPEILCTQRSRDYYQGIDQAIRIRDWDGIEHFRFDAPKNVRLLKGADNVVVTSYARTRDVLPLSPSAQVMDYYPAETRSLLTYPGIEASGYVLPDEKLLDTEFLPEDHVTSDLRAAEGPTASGNGRLEDVVRTGAVQAFSFAELTDPKPPWARSAGPFHGYCDFENVLARTTTRRSVRGNDTDVPAFTLIPFNLDDDGQTVEHLTATLFSLMPTMEHASPVCVAPFNMNLLNHTRLKKLVERCAKAAAAQNRLREFFFFFARDNAAIPHLRHLFRAAIVDGSDPDGLWNLERLRHIGIPSIVLTNTSNMPLWEKRAVPAPTFRTSYQSAVEFEDWFGKRVVVSDAPSSKEVADLMDMTDVAQPGAPEFGLGRTSAVHEVALEEAVS